MAPRPRGYYSGRGPARQAPLERQPKVRLPSFTSREWFLIGVVAMAWVLIAGAAAGIRMSGGHLDTFRLASLLAKAYLGIFGIFIVGMFLFALVNKRQWLVTGPARLALVTSLALSMGISLAPELSSVSAAGPEPFSVHCQAERTTTTPSGALAFVKDWRNTITCLVTLQNISTSPLEGFVLKNRWTTGGLRYKDHSTPGAKLTTTGLETFELSSENRLGPGETAQMALQFQPKCDTDYVEFQSRFASKELSVGIPLAEVQAKGPLHSLSGEVKRLDGSVPPNGMITAQTLCGKFVAQVPVVDGKFRLPQNFVEGQRYLIYGWFYPPDFTDSIIWVPGPQANSVKWTIVGGELEFDK